VLIISPADFEAAYRPSGVQSRLVLDMTVDCLNDLVDNFWLLSNEEEAAPEQAMMQELSPFMKA